MTGKLKKFLKTNKKFFEASVDSSVRDTYKGEINYAAGKIFFVVYITLFTWLLYIPSDLRLHQYPYFALCIRILLSVLSVILIAAKSTNKYKSRPDLLMKILLGYLYVGTALITATAGQAASVYIGGFCFVLMIPIFAPFTFKFKAVMTFISIGLFFGVGVFFDFRYGSDLMNYALNDLLVTAFLSLIFMHNQDKVRYASWEKQQKLNEMVKQGEENLKTISQLARHAEKMSEAKSEFIANTSHEIRTPMNAIIGMSDIILREKLPPNAHENMLVIKHAANNLLTIVNDILDISKIESGKLEINDGNYFFASLLMDVCSIIQTKALGKDIFFVTYINGAIPSKLYGDEVKIKQILLNLLGNAVKFTSKGHISLSVSGYIADGAVLLQFSVSDTGVGIKEKDMDKIFNKFAQVDIKNNFNTEGTGLGLVISKNLCMMMGGNVEFSSEYGIGSTFTATVSQKIVDASPLAVVNNPQEAKTLLYAARPLYIESFEKSLRNLNVPCKVVTKQSDFAHEIKSGDYQYIFIPAYLYEGARTVLDAVKPKAKVVMITEFGDYTASHSLLAISIPVNCISLSNVLNDKLFWGEYKLKEKTECFSAPEVKILLVDDVSTNLKVAEGLMSPYGLQIDSCLSGEKAMHMVRQNKYDIIFMDHMMPGMDGIETTNAIRGLGGEYETLPIIALTANAVSGMTEMFLNNGFNDFLAKPIEIGKLNEILKKWIPEEKQNKSVSVKSENAVINFKIEGVNLTKGIRNSGGDVDRYLKILEYFCTDIAEKTKDISVCLEQKDIKLFTVHIHAIKSAAANIGAERLSEQARLLEEAGKRKDERCIYEGIIDFLKDLRKIKRGIHTVLAVRKPNHKDSKEGTAEITGKLELLKTALMNVDADAMDEIVNSLSNNSRVKSVMSEISQHILMSDFDIAVKLADDTISSLNKDLR